MHLECSIDLFFQHLPIALSSLPYLISFSNGRPHDVVLDVTGTRTIPYGVEVKNKYTLPSLEDKFVIRMRKIPGKKWDIRNYVDTTSKRPVPILPLRVGNDVAVVCSLVYASSGIPGAFAPIRIQQRHITPSKIGYVNWDIDDNIPLWNELEAKHGDSIITKDTPPYIDGGTFENVPLRFSSTERRIKKYRNYTFEENGADQLIDIMLKL